MSEKFAKGGLVCLILLTALAVVVASNAYHHERRLMAVVGEVVAADALIMIEVDALKERVAELED
jgi:hypothetical protein